MDLYASGLYREDVNRVANLPLPWEKLRCKNVFLSGATGMIGSFFVQLFIMSTDSRHERQEPVVIYNHRKEIKRTER